MNSFYNLFCLIFAPFFGLHNIDSLQIPRSPSTFKVHLHTQLGFESWTFLLNKKGEVSSWLQGWWLSIQNLQIHFFKVTSLIYEYPACIT